MRIFTFLLCLLSSITFAKTATTNVLFSPYADLTINAYWSSEYQDMEPMDLVDISESSGVKNYHLAFINDAGSCTPAWGSQSSYSIDNAWGAHLTNKMREKNIDYIIAFGGANGNDLSQACKNTDLIQAYEKVIKTYQPKGLDFDIENGTADVPNLMRALKSIQQKYPRLKISFTLPVLPEGLTPPGEDIVKQAKAAGLLFTVNIMAMDYGPYYSGDMGQYAIQAATNLFQFLKKLYPEKTEIVLWQMITVTPMIGVNDVNVEQFTLENVDALRNFAHEKKISLSMWSIARDNPCKDEWASPICSGKNLQLSPYQFSQRFLQ